MNDSVDIVFILGALILALLLGCKVGWDGADSKWEKDVAKHGYGYFNENKEFVWK